MVSSVAFISPATSLYELYRKAAGGPQKPINPFYMQGVFLAATLPPLTVTLAAFTFLLHFAKKKAASVPIGFQRGFIRVSALKLALSYLCLVIEVCLLLDGSYDKWGKGYAAPLLQTTDFKMILV